MSRRLGAWPIAMFCAAAAAAPAWGQSPFKEAPGPTPVVRPVRPRQHQQQQQQEEPAPTVTTAPAPAPVVAAPQPPAPPPSLAGRWAGIMTCPGNSDAPMMVTVAPAGGDQYTMTASLDMGLLAVDERLSGVITAAKQISLDQQFMLDHRAIVGAVTSPTSMSGTFSSSFTGMRCAWTATKSQ